MSGTVMTFRPLTHRATLGEETGMERLYDVEERIWNEPPEGLSCALPIRTRAEARALFRECADETLAVAIQKSFFGNEAFEELFATRYHRRLGAWFFRWGVRDGATALDLTQELYLKFLRDRLKTYEPSRNFRAYLSQAAYHLTVARYHRARGIEGLEGKPEPSSGEVSPQHLLEAEELRLRFEEALRELPPLEAAVIQATEDGQTADEIATQLNVPRRVVYRRLFLARRAVEARLGLDMRQERGRKPLPTPTLGGVS